MTISHADLIAALESRYDYYSTRAVLKEILALANLGEKVTYDTAEVTTIVQVLRTWGDRTEHVIESLLEGIPANSGTPTEPGGLSEPPSGGDGSESDASSTFSDVGQEDAILGHDVASAESLTIGDDEHAEGDSADDTSAEEKSAQGKKTKAKKSK